MRPAGIARQHAPQAGRAAARQLGRQGGARCHAQGTAQIPREAQVRRRGAVRCAPRRPVCRSLGLDPETGDVFLTDPRGAIVILRDGRDLRSYDRCRFAPGGVLRRVRGRARYETYRRIAATALAALASRDVVPVVLKGAALAESVYAQPWLRHCHDVDLLVPRAQLAVAAASVVGAEFVRPPAQDVGFEHVAFAHPSGLPLRLHVEPSLPQAYAMAETFAARAVARDVCGIAVRVLPPAAALVHVCGHAPYHRVGEPLRWVCDAWRLLDRASPFDWDAAVAVEVALALPLAVQLDYLAGALEAWIPAPALAALRQAPLSAAHLCAAELGALCGSWHDVGRALAVARPGARVAMLARLVPHALLGPSAAAAGFPLPSLRWLRRTRR